MNMKGEIGEEERWAIHRAAPSYEELSNSQELLETGIKVIDLMLNELRAVKLVCSVVRV
ncbi:hypothetical protein ACLK18_21265 [Escherichia coli]